MKKMNYMEKKKKLSISINSTNEKNYIISILIIQKLKIKLFNNLINKL